MIHELHEDLSRSVLALARALQVLGYHVLIAPKRNGEWTVEATDTTRLHHCEVRIKPGNTIDDVIQMSGDMDKTIRAAIEATGRTPDGSIAPRFEDGKRKR